MSLLDSLPHRCTIRRRARTADSLGGAKDSFVDVQTGVECWEQKASDSEIIEFQKRGIAISRKLYFKSNPQVDERHVIIVTERMGVEQEEPKVLLVKSTPMPDADVGFGLLYRVMVDDEAP